MRKFALAAVGLFFTVGLALAAEVTFVKYDKEKKEVTVKEDDKETTYKITDGVKVMRGDKEMKSEDVMTYFETKAKEGKSKFEITAKDGKLTEIKMKGGKKKADKSDK